MNYRQYLLSKLAEEASEIAQIAIKSQVFGEESVDPRENGDNNRQKLEKEILDLTVIIKLLYPNYFNEGFNEMTPEQAIEYMEMKTEKVSRYYEQMFGAYE